MKKGWRISKCWIKGFGFVDRDWNTEGLWAGAGEKEEDFVAEEVFFYCGSSQGKLRRCRKDGDTGWDCGLSQSVLWWSRVIRNHRGGVHRNAFIPTELLREEALCSAPKSVCPRYYTPVMKNPDKPACPRQWKGLEEAVPQPSCRVLAELGCMTPFPWIGDGQRETALKVWVKEALEKETAWWSASVPRNLEVWLIHPGFRGHISSCHLASKECRNLPVILGLASLRYSWGLAVWPECKQRSLPWQGTGCPDWRTSSACLKANCEQCIGLTVPALDCTWLWTARADETKLVNTYLSQAWCLCWFQYADFQTHKPFYWGWYSHITIPVARRKISSGIDKLTGVLLFLLCSDIYFAYTGVQQIQSRGLY